MTSGTSLHKRHPVAASFDGKESEIQDNANGYKRLHFSKLRSSESPRLSVINEHLKNPFGLNLVRSVQFVQLIQNVGIFVPNTRRENARIVSPDNYWNTW